MELDQVAAFVAIVRHGGFTRAAAAIHLSQPAISRRVRLLEEELGAPLFERLAGGVVLTEPGRAFLPHAQAMVVAERDAVEAVRALRGGDRGQVALALVGTLASTSLTGCLRRFRERQPGIDLRLRTANSREVSELVRRGEATVGLRYGRDASADLASTKIHDEPMLPVGAPSVRSAAGQRWVAFPPRPGQDGDLYAGAIRRAVAEAEIIPVDSLTAQKRMVEAGFGIALLPASSVEEELRAGSLRVLRVAELRATIPVVLIHRRRGYLSGAARALIAELRAWPT